MELGAKAGVARAGTDGTADILGILNVKANVEVPFAAADASVKGGWYLRMMLRLSSTSFVSYHSLTMKTRSVKWL